MNNTILTGEAAADILAAMQKAGLNGWGMFVPEGVEEIAPGAFAGMKNLRRVQLPKTLQLRFMTAEIWLKSHCPPGWWNSAQRHSRTAACRR